MCSGPPALSACNVHPLLGAATSQDMKTDQIVRWRSWCAILCRTEAIIIPYFTTAGNINPAQLLSRIKMPVQCLEGFLKLHNQIYVNG